MFLWGRDRLEEVCVPAQLLSSEGKSLTVKVSHKKKCLDTVHSVLFESDCM